MTPTLFYYRNRSDLVAVSYDEGLTIILPTGRVIEVTDAWDDVAEDCHAELNAAQLRILNAMLPLQRDDEVGRIINRFAHLRRAVERRDGTHDDNFRIRDIPEGARVVTSDLKDGDLE